jgi:hypothetical protein
MERELFGAIRDNYNNASANLWYWHGRQNSFVKALSFFWVVFASLVMKIIGFTFGLGVFLDKISLWLQSKRDNVIYAIDGSVENLRYEKSAYIFTPITTLILAPIALLLGIVPKWSSTLVSAIHPDLDIGTGIEHGYFTKLGKSYLNLTKELFLNITNHGKLFFLPALSIAFLLIPLTSIIAIFFFILIILDFIGWFVGLIRKFVVSSSYAMARNTGNNIGGVITMPIFLTIFVPIYVALLLIPKIATYDEA